MRKLNEEVDVKQVIKDLSKSYGDSEEDKGKLASLIKGVAFSKEPEAEAFMKALDKWTTEYSNKNIKENTPKKIRIKIEEEIHLTSMDDMDFVLEPGDEIEIEVEEEYGDEMEEDDYEDAWDRPKDYFSNIGTSV